MNTIVKFITVTLLISLFTTSFLFAKESKDVMDNYELKKIAAHTWAVFGSLEGPNIKNKGFMNNPSFTITDKSVIVFDPGSNVYVGRALVKKIRKLTDNPITHIFNTHIHGDHWLANQGVFEENIAVKIYAHPEMLAEARAGEAQVWIDLMEDLTQGASKGTKIVYPTDVLKDGQEIIIDNITVKSHLNDYAHTKTDAMFEIKGDKVLITGDNAFNNRAPRLDDGSFVGNIAVLDKAMMLDVDVVLPGHGPVGGKEILTNFREYLYVIYDASKTLLDEDMEPFEMKPVIVEKMKKFEDWVNFDGSIGKLISVAVLEAENE